MEAENPTIYIIAGANGVGKTTSLKNLVVEQLNKKK